jgi:hypothetical protein
MRLAVRHRESTPEELGMRRACLPSEVPRGAEGGLVGGRSDAKIFVSLH